MRHKIDLTKDLFEAVDFSESVLVFCCPRILPSQVSFQIWGATLLTNWDWPQGVPLPPVNFDAQKSSIYVSGFGDLYITGAVGGELSVSLYEPGKVPADEFCRTRNGEKLTLARRWASESSEELHNYEMYCVLDWPFGYCHLSILAHGSAYFEFNVEDCVPVEEYTKHVDVYGFKKPID